MTETNKKADSLTSQSAWLMLAKIISFSLSLLLPFLVVRLLTKDQVGVYRQAFQVIINAVSILPLGFSMSAFYFLNREKERRKAAVLNILIFNFAVGGLACAGLYYFPQFLGNIFQSDEMTRLAPTIGIIIWLWIFSAFLEVIAVANQETRTATVFIVLAQLTKTILMAGAVVFFASIEAFLFAAMIQSALQTLILLFYLNSRFPRFWENFEWRFFREQALYAMPFGFAAMLYTLQSDIHNYFVGYHYSEAEYAIYAYGCFQLPLIGILGDATASVLLPRVNEMQARGDKVGIITLTAGAMEKLSFFYFPAYAFLLVTASVFVTTLFTKEFAASIPIFIINITLLPFNIFITDPITRAYKEFGRFLLLSRLCIIVCLVGALWFASRRLDLTSIITIVVVASLIDRLVSNWLVVRKIGFARADLKLLKGVGKAALSSFAAAVVTYFVFRQLKELTPHWGALISETLLSSSKQGLIDFLSGSLTLGLSFFVFAPVYIFCAKLLGVFKGAEKRLLRKFSDKFFGGRQVPLK